MAAFSSQEDLEEWLSDNPAEWAGVLAQRIALRVFPFIPISTADIDTPLRRFTHQSWRVLLISSVAPNIPAEDIRAASFTDGSLDARAALAGRVALDAPLDNLYTRYVLDADATWLEENGDPAGLAARPLWPDGMPQAFQEIWQDARPALAASLPLIADWYDRRLQGAATAFNLPPDADLAVIQRIAAARAELWDLDPRAINDTIAGWIEEARPVVDGAGDPVARLAEMASPDVSKQDDKLHAGPNPRYDKADYAPGLADLPAMLRSLAQTLLNAAPGNLPAPVRQSLTQYHDHLRDYGAAPILGLLQDAMDIATDGLEGSDLESWEPGLGKALERFKKRHAEFLSHYPLNPERETILASIALDEEKITNTLLRGIADDLKEIATQLKTIQGTTEEFDKILSAQQQIIRDVASLPNAPQDTGNKEITPKSALFLVVSGFLSVSLKSELTSQI